MYRLREMKIREIEFHAVAELNTLDALTKISVDVLTSNTATYALCVTFGFRKEIRRIYLSLK